MAGADADAAHADATTRLRVLCLSAAAGIRDECGYVLQQTSVNWTDNGRGREEGDEEEEGREKSRSNGADLTGCGEPLVQLLSRQASGLLGRYQGSSSPSSSLSPSSQQSLSSPVGPGQPAGNEQEPDAVRSHQGGKGGEGGHLILARLDDLISVAYSRFYAYLYGNLPLCWRQLYTDASILKFSYLFLSSLHPLLPPRPDGNGNGAAVLSAAGRPERDAGILPDAQLDEMVKTLDLALILAGAGGHSRGRKWIDAAFELLEEVWAAHNGDRRGGPPPGKAVTITSPPAAKRPRIEEPPVVAHTKEASQSHHPSSSSSFFSTHEPFTPPVRSPIRRVSAGTMDMTAFQRYLDGADPQAGPTPLVLAGLVDDWPARTDRPWDKPSYLLARTFEGRRLVPVEVGRSYVDEGWGQKLVTFGDFLTKYIDPSFTTTATSSSAESASAGAVAAAAGGKVGHDRQDKPVVAYLAQHQLFLQLPQLRRDILVPDHCYTAPPPHPTDPVQDQPELDSPMLNAWLGPPGTITPLHTDPYHNLLAQVVGRKYVRLYSPAQTGRMRARGKEGGVEMGNTSLVDVGVVEGWDDNVMAMEEEEEEDYYSAATAGHDEDDGNDDVDDGGAGDERDNNNGSGNGDNNTTTTAEDFREVPFVDCILEPGDALYIPIGWWHYVRGLSVSFSVSLWWN